MDLGGVGPGDATRPSSTLGTRTPAKRAGSSDAACRHGLTWDHTVFHVVASCRANPAMVAPSKRNCRIAQRIARTPTRAQGAHTLSLCSRNVTVWQVRSRHSQRRIMPPDPHRNPGPRRIGHRHHHTPATSSKHPTTRAASTAITGLSVEHQTTLTPSHAHQMETCQTDEQITPITTTKRHRAAAGRERHRPRSLTTAGVEVRSSSRTSTSTRTPRPTPGHPHSTLKSHQMHVSSPRDWTAQINSKCSHTTEPLHVRNGSGVQVPLDSRATDRGAPSS